MISPWWFESQVTLCRLMLWMFSHIKLWCNFEDCGAFRLPGLPDGSRIYIPFSLLWPTAMWTAAQHSCCHRQRCSILLALLQQTETALKPRPKNQTYHGHISTEVTSAFDRQLMRISWALYSSSEDWHRHRAKWVIHDVGLAGLKKERILHNILKRVCSDILKGEDVRIWNMFDILREQLELKVWRWENMGSLSGCWVTWCIWHRV